MIQVLDPAPDDVLLQVLAPSPEWTAYALCDLDPPYRNHARFVAALEDATPIAAALLYSLPGIHSLLPYGSVPGVEAIMATMVDAPPVVFFLAEVAHLPAMERRYEIEDHWSMDRMTVHARDVRPARQPELPVRRLVAADVPDVQSLYRLWGNTPFEAEMLETGIYVGAWDGIHLTSVAGTHAVSRRRRIAAIGGVFTHPDYRNRGLATATTGTVCRMLSDVDVDLIVLNVRSDNAPAVKSYQSLGFTRRLGYREGRAALR